MWIEKEQDMERSLEDRENPHPQLWIQVGLHASSLVRMC